MLLLVGDDGTTANIVGEGKVSENAVFAEIITAIENLSSTYKSVRLTDITLRDRARPESVSMHPVAFIFRQGMWTWPRDEDFQISVPPHDQCLLCLLFCVSREMTHAEIHFPTLETLVLPITQKVEQGEG